MKYKKVMGIELEFSALGLGCWPFSGEGVWDNYSDKSSITTIQSAIDHGINFFDVAPVYGLGYAEKILGKATNDYVDRDQIIIASKCGLVWDKKGKVTNNLTKASLLKEIDDSLKRLQTDYIDIYQIHWADKKTPLEETMKALNAIKEQGKIKYVGVSNFSIGMVEEASKYMKVSSFQGLYNMLERNPETYHTIPLEYRTESEVLPYCKENNMAFFPYSPLMQGLLTGEFKKEDNFSENDVRNSNPKLSGDEYEMYYNKTMELKKFAGKIGKSLVDVAINWLYCKDAVTSIISGASTESQILDNIKAIQFELTEGQLQEIGTILA